MNETDKNPCPPVAYRLICVSKRSPWLLHGEGVVGEQEWKQGDGLGLPWQYRGEVIRIREVTVDMGGSGWVLGLFWK